MPPLIPLWLKIAIKRFLEEVGALNKTYDSDLDGVVEKADSANDAIYAKYAELAIDADTVDGYHGADLEKVANKGVAGGYCELDTNSLVPLIRIPTPLTGKDADSVDGYHGADLLDKATYDSDADGVIDLTAIPTIPRTKLEYPTEDVSFAYLASINKIQYSSIGVYGGAVITLDSFTDKAVETVTNPYNYAVNTARHQDKNNYYINRLIVDATTADHDLMKIVAGAATQLAVESVDIDKSGEILCISCSGSTIKSLRYLLSSPTQSIINITPTAIISATDTSFTSGYFGFRPSPPASPPGYCDTTSARLIIPQTNLPKAQRIIELEITDLDLIKPNFSHNFVDVDKLTNIPNFLKEEAKRYEMLKAKGFTDEEISLLFGYIPQHHVDLNAITWGAFDYKGESTILVIITRDNPYQSGAILTQEEYAKSKGLKIFKPPRDLTEARELHKQIKADRPEIIAGVHNLAYQCIGDENLEPLAIADYYDGFTQGIYDMKNLDRVPDWELERIIKRQMDRLERGKVTAEEKDKHIKKLKTFQKL